MRHLTVIAALFFSTVLTSASFANDALNFETLFKTLNTPEINVSTGEGLEVVQKAVPGLACMKSTYVMPGAKPEFNCIIMTQGLNSTLLFQMLNVAPVQATGEGAVVMKKAIPGLTCTQTNYVLPGSQPVFSCSMNLKF